MAKKVVSVTLDKKKLKPIKHTNKRKIKLKSVLTKIFNYMKSDSYMFAPLAYHHHPHSHTSLPASFRASEEVRVPLKKKEKKLVEGVKEYLKCDCYMYAPLLHVDSHIESGRVSDDDEARVREERRKEDDINGSYDLRMKQSMRQFSQISSHVPGKVVLSHKLEHLKVVVGLLSWISLRCYISSTMKARVSKMCINSETSLKEEFLKRWIKGLHICRNHVNKTTNIFDRKNAIKLSADVAIASTRNPTTNWSRALLSDVVSRDNNRILVQQILGHKPDKKALITCSKRIVRRSHIAHRKASRLVPRTLKSSSMADRKLVKNRTSVLQRLVPGGEKMDGVSLIEETLDYIVSLRVQVDVMRSLATAAQRLETNSKNILICN